MFRFTVVSLCLLVSVHGQCLKEPAEWVEAFQKAFKGKSSATPCADKNLMIRFDTGYPATDPPALHAFNNFWTWAADSDSMDRWMDEAPKYLNRGSDFAHEIMVYLGFTDTSVTASNRYVFSVFKRDEMQARMPFNIFQPTWQNVFDYFYDFTECKFNGEVDDCPRQTSVQFSEDVRRNLTDFSPSEVTDCPTKFEDYSTCSDVFTEMNNALYDERNGGGGVLGAMHLYQAYTNTAGEQVPMLSMVDDQARAFLNIVMGATWLFTGSGSSNNGMTDTGKEYIVRGDVPLYYSNGVRIGERAQVYP